MNFLLQIFVMKQKENISLQHYLIIKKQVQ